ncbi:helix-turn-helix transcriptional regulator [Agrococcus carbonis]|uniref:Regulatory protein, luxR family n=1 Tax=Agrococcus carbonis TaxID=684552 RepID=A0A1H1SD63_9MICO|nr:helix-turn-helix transcriptional regulator [Agrococcus carbonis]SDS45748.1 regulatory protein, luxR family [Agrococcus carbonis]
MAAPPSSRSMSGARVAGVAAAVIASAAVLLAPAVVVVDALPVLLVPWMLVVTGAVATRWRASGFVCACLLAIGAAQLVALALSAVALSVQQGSVPSVLHALSQAVFGASFALLVPLAAGYPGPRAPRWTWSLVVAPLLLALAAALSGPSPAVLGGTPLPPVAAVLPPTLAAWGAAIFALPLAATAVGVARWILGDRDLRVRLQLPLAALAVLASVVLLGAVTPAASRVVTDALFFVTAPLLPIALAAGSRSRGEPDAERIRRDLADIAARVDALGSRLEPVAPPPDAARALLASLTPRERAVLERVAQGRSNAAISSELHLSVSAVEKHVGAVFAKLGIPASPDLHRRVAAATAWHRGTAGEERPSARKADEAVD